MPFIQKDLPQYHYADDDGLIGLRGAMYYFQNIHTWHLHSIDKGNDVLPQKYEAGWIYTRYHVVLKQKMDYRGELTLRAWMEPYRQPVLVNENIEILQHGKIAACGKLECCVFSLARQRPLRLTAVDFPENFAEDVPNDIPDFLGIEKTADGTEERYIRTVRASDLDVNRHMNNLHYIAMFQDACDSSFWRDFSPKEMEICFMSQCKEGEAISVRSKMTGDAVHFAALHQNGQIASVADHGHREVIGAGLCKQRGDFFLAPGKNQVIRRSAQLQRRMLTHRRVHQRVETLKHLFSPYNRQYAPNGCITV